MPTLPPARAGDPVAAIDTPALVVDLDAFERNLDLMANAVRGAGVALRPHAKSHKCPEIARRADRARRGRHLLPEGRRGRGVRRRGHPRRAGHQRDRRRRASSRGSRRSRSARRSACSSTTRQRRGASAAAATRGRRDARRAGRGRRRRASLRRGAGRAGGARSRTAIARAAGPAVARPARLPRRARSICARRRSGAPRSPRGGACAAQSKAAIEAAGLACPVVTGAGTGTWQLERDSGVYTELQPGSYVFMDADYGRNALAADQHHFEQSLFVLATVMSVAGARARGRRRGTEGAGVRLRAAAGLRRGRARLRQGVRRARRASRSPTAAARAAARRPAVARPRSLRPDGQPARLDRRRARRARSRASGRWRRAARWAERHRSHRSGLHFCSDGSAVHAADAPPAPTQNVTMPLGVRSIAAIRVSRS